MNRHLQTKHWLAGVLMLGMMIAGPIIRDAAAITLFDSTSSCATDTVGVNNCLGDYNPPANDTIVIPPSGVLNYHTFTVPRGVTVTFQKNANNTPVTILVSGNVIIYGNIVLNGTSATNSGTAGDGNLGDDGQPGLGGPGGFAGGYGGYASLFGGVPGQAGGAGKGPGGGQSGSGYYTGDGRGFGGGGASFATTGGVGGIWPYSGGAAAGSTYGQGTLLPLVGGSGGGGASAGSVYSGAGGGGGGGAITLASSGTIFLGIYNYVNGNCYVSWNNGCTSTFGGSWGSYGRIYADGGGGGANNGGNGQGGGGAGGSGGAIRLVANTITRGDEGYLEALGGGGGGAWDAGGAGGNGFIRIEANTSNWLNGNTGYANPGTNAALPGHVFVPNSPALFITSVTSGGTTTNVPANPTGNADVTLPQGSTTATVSIEATNIPIGTTVTVYVVPATGANRSSSPSNALAGSDVLSTATATVTLSPGNNVLMAAATYTVTEQIILGMNLPTFDNGIRVAKIRVESTMGGESKVTYITANGKEYPADSPHRDAPGRMKKAAAMEKKG